MRWLLVKFANLVIVLIIVTFIVAAIFTGPLADRQKANIATNVRQESRALFQQNKEITQVYTLAVGYSGEEKVLQALNNTANTILASPDKYGLDKYPPDQQQAIVNAVISAARSEFLAGSKVSTQEFIQRVVNKANATLAAQGIVVDHNTLQNVVNGVVNEFSAACRDLVVRSIIQIRIHKQGLDKPWFLLSLRYTKMLLTFKPLQAYQLSTQYWPYQGDRNALHIILERLPYSITLFTTSSILTLLVAMPLALYAARRPGSILDSVITGWSVFSVSMPWWWLAMVFIYLFTVRYHVFPSPYLKGIQWNNPIEVAKMAALPVFTVTVLSIGDTSYRIRNILLDVFNEDFVTVARAKGVPERIVLRKHVIRPAAPPLVTIVLFSIVLSVFSGAIITELIFNWFGLGRLYWDAIENNDVPVILELTYITTLLYLALRFILDILYTYLDPRIRRA